MREIDFQDNDSEIDSKPELADFDVKCVRNGKFYQSSCHTLAFWLWGPSSLLNLIVLGDWSGLIQQSLLGMLETNSISICNESHKQREALRQCYECRLHEEVDWRGKRSIRDIQESIHSKSGVHVRKWGKSLFFHGVSEWRETVLSFKATQEVLRVNGQVLCCLDCSCILLSSLEGCYIQGLKAWECNTGQQGIH